MPLTEEQQIYAAIDVYVSIAEFEWSNFTYYVTRKMTLPERGYVGFHFLFTVYHLKPWSICNHK